MPGGWVGGWMGLAGVSGSLISISERIPIFFIALRISAYVSPANTVLDRLKQSRLGYISYISSLV